MLLVVLTIIKLGSLYEVLSICEEVETQPVINWAHLYLRDKD
jgi:endonuclease IV